MNNNGMKTKFSTNVRIVPLNDKGLPSTRKQPVLGDMYLSPSLTEPEMFDQWIWAGDTLEWQKIGSIPSFDDEKARREERVENVKTYFKRKREEELIEKAWEEVPSWREYDRK